MVLGSLVEDSLLSGSCWDCSGCCDDNLMRDYDHTDIVNIVLDQYIFIVVNIQCPSSVFLFICSKTLSRQKSYYKYLVIHKSSLDRALSPWETILIGVPVWQYCSGRVCSV